MGSMYTLEYIGNSYKLEHRDFLYRKTATDIMSMRKSVPILGIYIHAMYTRSAYPSHGGIYVYICDNHSSPAAHN